MRRRAFTLIEMVVVLFILSVLLLVALPNVSESMDRQKSMSAAKLLMSDLHLLQEKSRSPGMKGHLRIQDRGRGYDLLLQDGNGDRKVFLSREMPKNLKVGVNLSTTDVVLFKEDGSSQSFCTFSISQMNGSDPYQIVVYKTGRVREGGVR